LFLDESHHGVAAKGGPKPEFDSLDHGVAAKGGPKPEFDSLDS
jgi:hypothetical protein